MTTTEQVIDQDFARYVQEHMPAHLAADTSADGEGARTSWRADARRTWLMRLAQGWRPGELLGDEAPPEVHLVDGSPKRRPFSEVSPQLEYRAAEVARELGARAIHIDVLAQATLDMALDSPVNKVEWAIATGLDAIARYEAQRRNAAAEQQAMTLIRVTMAFRGIGGKEWAVGDYRVSPEELQELAVRQQKVEAEALRREWAPPAPPFYVV